MRNDKVPVVTSKGSPTLLSNPSDSRSSELWEEAMESEGLFRITEKASAETIMQAKTNKGEHTFTPRSPP